MDDPVLHFQHRQMKVTLHQGQLMIWGFQKFESADKCKRIFQKRKLSGMKIYICNCSLISDMTHIICVISYDSYPITVWLIETIFINSYYCIFISVCKFGIFECWNGNILGFSTPKCTCSTSSYHSCRYKCVKFWIEIANNINHISNARNGHCPS